MTSWKGFLQSPGPDSTPRMTARQQHALLDALVAVRDHALKEDDPPLSAVERMGLAYAEAVIATAFTTYPNDRSCWTCDFLDSRHHSSHYCRHYHQDVPAEYLDRGCDHHQDHGAPF